MSLKFAPEILKAFFQDDFKIAALVCVLVAILTYLFFYRERLARIRFAALMAVMVFLAILVTQFVSKARVNENAKTIANIPASDIVIPAITFTSGKNVARGPLPNLYGSDVLMNAPPFTERSNSADFTVCASRAGKYNLVVRYAARESRPIHVFVNEMPAFKGQPVLTETTGGWLPANQKSFDVGEVELISGMNTVRLYSPRPFPHITLLVFKPDLDGKQR